MIERVNLFSFFVEVAKNLTGEFFVRKYFRLSQAKFLKKLPAQSLNGFFVCRFSLFGFFVDNFKFAITRHARTSGNKFADNDIFL